MRVRAAIAAFAMAALAALAWSAHGSAVEADTSSPRVEQRVEDGVYVVEGRFEVSVPIETIWAVLTDYDGFPRFVRAMRASKVRSRRGDQVFVEQVAEARALVFTRTMRVLLEVHETPRREIRFRDVSHRDFDLYEGSWTLTREGDSTEVVYRLRARPRKSVPHFIGADVVKDNAIELLDAVRAEMLARG